MRILALLLAVLLSFSIAYAHRNTTPNLRVVSSLDINFEVGTSINDALNVMVTLFGDELKRPARIEGNTIVIDQIVMAICLEKENKVRCTSNKKAIKKLFS